MENNEDRWIWVNPKSDSKKLTLRFRVKSFDKQFFLSTGLIDTKDNRTQVRQLRDAIEKDIFLGEFDPTLERYQKFKKKKNDSAKIKILTLPELWNKYTEFQSNHLEKSTIEQHYFFVKQVIGKLPNLQPASIREFLLENYSYFMARKIIESLKVCYQWGMDSGFAKDNPFEKLRLPKKKKKKESQEAYTAKERDLIIKAFENDSKWKHYADIIKFLFWTGCRPGEAIALTWGNVSLNCLEITFDKSYSSKSKYLKGTKNGKTRIFTCSQGSKLQQMLLYLRHKQSNPDAESLVFTSKKGGRITIEHLDQCWRGRSTGDYEYPGVVKTLANQGEIEFLNLYRTRHTFATLAIGANISPDQVAYLLGDDLLTVLKYYCHPGTDKKPCPDF